MVFGSSKKTINSSIKKIRKGHGSPKHVDSLTNALHEHPELLEDAAFQLIGILQNDKTKSFGLTLDALLNIAEMDPDLLANSVDVLINLIQTPDDILDINGTLKAMDILSILAANNPELMASAVHPLLKSLNSSNSHIRSASYYILDIIAKPHPEFFSNYTLDLIRSLHGLNIDERVYAARLIGEVASASPDIVHESYEVLNDLAYKHPDTKVRQEAYDVLKKIKPEETVETKEEAEEEMLEFEKDFIGMDDIASEVDDFGELADELAERIEGIDFETSASEMLKSLGMDHLIVKPVSKDAETAPEKPEDIQKPEDELAELISEDIQEDEVIELLPEEVADVTETPENKVLKKLPPKPKVSKKTPPEHALKRIEQLVTDPNIKPRLSPIRDITKNSDIESPKTETKEDIQSKEGMGPDSTDQKIVEAKTEAEEIPEEEDATFEELPDITIEMLHAIFTDLSHEDWVTNVGLTTNTGKLVTADDPDSLNSTFTKKICDMLNFEKSLSNKEGFRNRVSLELSDKLLVAMSIDSEYILIVFTKPDVKFGIVLYQLNRTAEKIEKILG